MKQAIFIRRDLHMRRGKEIVQGCHASIGAFYDSKCRDTDIWEACGSKKICFQVKSLSEIHDLKQRAESAGIVASLVTDAGLTELRKPSVTALAIGPAEDSMIDSITKDCELY